MNKIIDKTDISMGSIDRSSTKPLFRQVAFALKQQINNGTFPSGSTLPTLNELSKNYGINLHTVRAAIKLLQEEKLVVSQSGRGTVVIGEKYSKVKLALILPSLGSNHIAGISAGLQKTLEGMDWSLDTMDYHYDLDRQSSYVKRLLSEDFTAAILFADLNPETIKPLLQLFIDGFPVVFIERSFQEIPCWAVKSCDLHGGYIGTRHLIEQGYKRIAFHASRVPSITQRLNGYKQALLEAGIPFDSSLVAYCEDEPEYGTATKNWLSRENSPDAFFFHNGHHASVGFQIVQATGYSIGKEIGILGYDDTTFSQYSLPRMTVIKQFPEEIGRRAGKLLIEQIRTPLNERFTSRTENVDVELVIRESTLKP